MLELMWYATYFAVDAPAAPDLYDYGFAGIIIALVATGTFRYKGEVQDLRADLKEQRELNRQQNEIIKSFSTQLTVHTLPAMTKQAQVLEAVPDKEAAMFEKLQATQEEAKEILKRLEKFSQGGSSS